MNYQLQSVTGRLSAGTLKNLPNTARSYCGNSSFKSPVYCIVQALIVSDLITVDFTLNDEWLEAQLSLSSLKAFITSLGLNEWCFKYSNSAGDHVQDEGIFDMNTFIEDSLNEALQAYLEAKRFGQLQVN